MRLTLAADTLPAHMQPMHSFELESESDSAMCSCLSRFGRLDYFFKAHNTCEASRKKAHLLTLSGEETFETVHTLFHPKTLLTVSYDKLRVSLCSHFDQWPYEVYNRMLF